MDGLTTPSDHSDSDSGESWTLLEHSPQDAEDVPDFSRDTTERITTNEKDDDTDGISILSDSDHDSTVFLKNNAKASTEDEIMKEYMQILDDTFKPHPSDIEVDQFDIESFNDSTYDFPLDSNGRLKTYVHRRNKRLSTILNIIMLGSVITAAGVAIGHMWGAKNDCVMPATPSVNKILSNLYKLQEENAFLRSKLKELTMSSNTQKQQQKISFTQQRCKKVFEGPLNDMPTNKATKCIDKRSIDHGRILERHLVEPAFEREFLNDMNQIKAAYEQNRHWLDDDISIRLQFEGQHKRHLQKQEKPIKQKPPFKENKTSINENLKPFTEKNSTPSDSITVMTNDEQHESHAKIASYADSLKTECTQKPKGDIKKESVINENFNKKKLKRLTEPSPKEVPSEEEIKKDDRYKSYKSKYNRKKNEKWHKKQAKRNTYNQLDIIDQLKVFDDNLKQQDGNVQKKYQDHSINQMPITDSSESKKEGVNFGKENAKMKREINPAKEMKSWYEKRASMRKESRKKLEMELFGEKSLNDSGWYFRRMKRREQCRAKAYNSTHKKDSKLNMNFKMKY